MSKDYKPGLIPLYDDGDICQRGHFTVLKGQTCLKGSPKARTESGCLRQVTP